jgi:hypothetical protein
LNMDDAGQCLLVPSVVEGCYEISYHTLHQLLILLIAFVLHYITCSGCCSSQCRRPTLPSCCLHRVALATSITSLRTIPDLTLVAKDIPASMLLAVCALVRLLSC